MSDSCKTGFFTAFILSIFLRSCLILQCGWGIFNTPILMSPTFDMKWQDSFVKIPSLIKIIQIGSPIQLPLPLRPPHWAPQQVSRSLHSYSYQSRAGADGRRVELQTKVKKRFANISQSRIRPLLGTPMQWIPFHVYLPWGQYPFSIVSLIVS